MTLTRKLMSKCRTCGERGDVICYDPRGLWAYPFRKTYCPEHCPEHDYARDPGFGIACQICGSPPDMGWYDRD